jgi:hypothetical protein
MRKRRWIFVVAPVGLVLFVALGGYVVMQLWNWLTPELFGWRSVTFWQALGLLALCRILFGGWGGRGGHGPKARGCRQMTPEEREQLRQKLRARQGGGEPLDANTEA